MIGAWLSLRRAGIVGINRRNAALIMPYNRRSQYPLVDNKLRTKELALEHDIPVPPLYGVIATPHDIRGLETIVKDHKDFVVKPAHGSQGDGIMVIVDRTRKGFYRTAGGRIVAPDGMSHHLSNALNGQYSLGGQPDQVLVEYRVDFDPIFEGITFQGVPDIRIVVYRGFPIMAMVRLPTKDSDGKANLHQGAVGAGVDLVTGRTLTGVVGNRAVDEHPDTGEPIAGVALPYWRDMLLTAARCHDITRLGYLGVDLVLDAGRGPLMLELNARPGLNIQLANQDGIMRRIDAIDALGRFDLPAEARVDAAVDVLGSARG